MPLAAVVALLLAEGRPLYYWGAKPPVIEASPRPTGAAERAEVAEVHAVVDGEDLIVRFTFDRPVRDALRLEDGTPVSGRLHATLLIDADDDRKSGWDAGELDLRTGAERRIEITGLFIGGDPDEERKPAVEVIATMYGLSKEGRRRLLWRQGEADPRTLSIYGEYLELRIPEARIGLAPGARFILSGDAASWDGRI